MKTAPALPVIFTAFANPHGDLSNLTQEQNGIQDALGALEAKGKIKHLIRTDTDLNAYFDFLQRWNNQIVLFHYAGHANSEALLLQNASTFFKPLAEELLARNPESLELVFLNGCSTYGHVETLFDLGVPAVIASSVPIDDKRAMQLATRFYGNLAQGDSIEAAYKSAANYVKGSSTESRFRNLGEIHTWRSISFREKDPIAEFPWGLYIREEGILENKNWLDFSETMKNEAENKPPDKTLLQNAEKIYNIEKIDTANFS
ncbi:MAG: CHAT domain-containing protein [Saprospiraceae bacterium]